MGIVFIGSGFVVTGMLFLGLHLLSCEDRDSRITGFCTTLWVALSAYLFFTQWMPAREQHLIQLISIAVLGTMGYPVGRAVAALTRPEPGEQTTWRKRSQWHQNPR